MWPVLCTFTRQWVVFIQGIRRPHTYSCGFSSDALAIWLREQGDVEVNAEINLEQQSIYQHPTHLQFDPDVTSFL